MKIGICGGGIVGNAIARSYIEHVEEVRIYDIVEEKCTHTLDSVLASNIVFICLPTPQKKDSLECDTSIVDDFCNMLGGSCPNGNYVLRSTVPIGTTRKLREKYHLPNLVHSPEFLTARCAVVDAQIPARNIIGDPSGYLNLSACGYKLRRLYEDRFPSVNIHFMTSDESEAVKLFQNSFFAVKIAFMNEINLLASKLGLDWNIILQGMLSDGRISPSHTNVPGPDGLYGYGGACINKDLANLITCIYDNQKDGLDYPYMTEAAMKRNEVIDRKRKD